jgi:uncharacterized protein (DUF849 family)
VVINLTTGGAATMTVEERLQPALQLKPEVASLNMGSMNFGLYEMLGRFKEFKHDWERPYLEGSDDRIFKNTFRDIAYILQSCSENGTRFEIECYDIGHLYTAAHFLDRGLVKPPLLHPVGVRYPRRHRPASRGRDAHEAHRRSPVRRRSTTGRCSARAATRCSSPRCRR